MARKSLVSNANNVVVGTFNGTHHVTVGQLVGVDEAGVALVDFEGNTHGPLPARIVGLLSHDDALRHPPVALSFEGGDRSRPLIMGVVSDRVQPASGNRELMINGKKIELTADTELQLRCGNASIALRRDGKLVIKGTEVISRASGANKIRGGLVNIN